MTNLNPTGFPHSAWSASDLTNFITNLTVASVNDAVTPAGSSRSGATALSSVINNCPTVGSGTGVVLPSAASVGIGGYVDIYNDDAANALKVYGAGSDTIDAVAGSTGVTLTHAKRCRYTVFAANTWVSAQLGAVSA